MRGRVAAGRHPLTDRHHRRLGEGGKRGGKTTLPEPTYYYDIGGSATASQKWTFVVRRKELRENTLELVVEAPTLEAAKRAALTAGLTANAGDMDWELYDYDWAPGEPPTLDSHTEAGTDAVTDLVADAEGIRIKGLLHPIVLYENKILDGRNRYLACPMAGVEPRFTVWQDTGSPLEWVISVWARGQTGTYSTARVSWQVVYAFPAMTYGGSRARRGCVEGDSR